MTARTRYFAAGSLAVLVLGVTAGLVAFYTTAGQNGSSGLDDDLAIVPPDASLLAFANVQEVMISDLRQRLQRMLPMSGDGQRDFFASTGIDIEHDIDRVLVALVPAAADARPPVTALVVARGRFDVAKVEGFLNDRGAAAEEYRGRRVLGTSGSGGSGGALTFVEPGLVALGSLPLVRAAIDRAEGGPNVKDNADMMRLVTSLGDGNVWAVGRVDALTSGSGLPANLLGALPAVTWFSVNGHVNGGIRGALRLETRDEQAAGQLREMVRGLVSVAKFHTQAQPDVQALLDSLQPGGTGTTVSLAFDVPATIFERLPAPSARTPQ
jgi:hypothetical protein